MSWKHAAGKFFCSFFCAMGFLVVAILLLNPSVAEAVDKYWNVTSGDWSDTDPCPWNPSTEPTSSDNAYIQNGGTASITQTDEKCSYLYLGEINTGTVEMSGGSLYASNSAFIGNSGTGTFTQTGGTNSIFSVLYFGYNSGSSGSYDLSDSGQLSTGNEYIGQSGTGTFTQTGGTNSISYYFCLGYNFGSSGKYTLSGGTNSITNYLYLGYYSGSSGTYNLNDTGQLSAKSEYIGDSGTGKFTQTSGTNTVTYVKIGSNGTYALTNGILNINGGLENQGIWDLSNSSTVINMASSIINLSGTIYITGQNTTLNIDAHSLLIFPKGHDPAEYFASINNEGGIIHQAGSTLNISSDYSIYGIGTIDDHVSCQGTLAATSTYSINLNGGLNISGTGNVNLGIGKLYVNDAISGMGFGSLKVNQQFVGSAGTGTFNQTGGTNIISSTLYLGFSSGSSGIYYLSDTGQLSAAVEYIGLTGTGTFTQTGGTNSISMLDLGYDSGSNGMYNLSGTGQLSAYSEYIGYTGTGTFTQTGGMNTISSDLYLGGYYGLSGTYNLSDTGQLSASHEYIGYYRTGTFTQTGGKNSINNNLYLGYNSGSSGTYNLNGGMLILKSLSKGSGTAAFNFGGGTLQASGNFTITLPMTLTGIGGNANIDTLGYTVVLSGLISGSGGLNKLGTGTLEFIGGINTSGSTLINIQSGTAILETVSVNKKNLNINTAALATFEVVNGIHAVGAISGGGITQIDSGASLTVASIAQDTLTIGSGATVTIQAIPGGPLGGAINPVPEPSTLFILTGALILFTLCWINKSRR